MPSLRIFLSTIGRDLRASVRFFRILAFLKRCYLLNRTPLSLFNQVVKKRRDKVCFVFEGQEWTFAMVEDWSNRLAQLFWSRGFRKGDEVALLMENCPEYVCTWLGLAKIGVVTALINTNQQGESLAHSINVVEAKAVIFGANFAPALQEVLPTLRNKDSLQFFCYGAPLVEGSFPSAHSLNDLLEEASSEPINPKLVNVTFADKALYIYTSGTTGLPKAAIIRHSRLLYMGVASKYICDLGEEEIYYNPLPLYHSAGGLVFVAVVLMFGGKMVIRKKFSASNFWKEVAEHNVTVSQYIGEICRYLLNQPYRPEESRHGLQLLFGNGLKRHLWQEFQDRFRIPRIVELYGSTEGNANLINVFGKVGAVGFLPRICSRLYPVSLIRVDLETGKPVRNAKGLCIRCKPGEPGEMVGKIINNGLNSFDGYANKSETNKKIIRDCFDKGDIAFLSGDILVMDEEGYTYFMDRTGDTFRWRGENVSSTEVENVLSKALGHAACVVYGVEIPGVEGRAGMATVQVSEVNFEDLLAQMSKSLPTYALPIFFRLSADIEATGTYKLRKVSLQKEGYDPGVVADPLFFLDRKRKTYVPLTPPLYSDIVQGTIQL